MGAAEVADGPLVARDSSAYGSQHARRLPALSVGGCGHDASQAHPSGVHIQQDAANPEIGTRHPHAGRDETIPKRSPQPTTAFRTFPTFFASSGDRSRG